MRVAVGADHAGFALKERVRVHLEGRGHAVLDMGTASTEPTDYPQYAFRVAEAVRDGIVERGVLVCDTGNGIAIAANKVHGIRAALVINARHAEMSRRHNDANIMVLGSAILPEPEEIPLIDAWLSTPFDGGRHARRLGQISTYEQSDHAR